jgi:hypothetical protein
VKFLITILAAVNLLPAATIVYTKSFPGSSPAYVSIKLESSGEAEFNDAPTDENAMRFKLSAEDAKAVFDLAEKLGFFTRPLESGLNVAKMGLKTFRFEDGKTTHEQQFNYSTEPEAQQLHDWFEKITETELYLINLEKCVRFDHLGVLKALLQLEAAWDRKRIVAPEQLLNMLDRVAKSEKYLNLARDRAAKMADSIRGNTKPKA